eukprot:CAMPEP_0173423254 /NCGR_PEP_ID=MMETSP1357-20121228/3633_1 /TAXON_ID=77926 /ORGANISM="Hemiselmis rufescens, Strain PCC563" /LENGTH=224 /DNA_ID=CAMNT_0014386347 /DNA_START=219 /DNA_END=889 /DNA_ORIENTATION=-
MPDRRHEGRGGRGWEDESEEPLMEAGRRAELEEAGWSINEEGAGGADAAARRKGDDSFKLLMSFLAMVLIGSGNKVFQKIQTIPMHNYPYFLNLYSTFIYLPVSFLYIIPMHCFNKFSKEELSIPQSRFMVMGLLDGFAALMQVFAVTKIASGALLILLSQSAIPISMLISRLLLSTRYSPVQYMGAAIVMSGIAVVLYPDLYSGKVSLSSPGGQDPSGGAGAG